MVQPRHDISSLTFSLVFLAGLALSLV